MAQCMHCPNNNLIMESRMEHEDDEDSQELEHGALGML